MDYLERKSLGLCASCNRKPVPGQVLCMKCKFKREKIRQQKDKSGICRYCSNPRTHGIRCDKCWKSKEDRHKRIRNVKREDGITNVICRICESKEVLEQCSFCRKCYFKKTSNNHFGTVKHWKELERIFEEQTGRCVYSGHQLKLGQNTALDHILPKSKGGVAALDNVQWVTREVNQLKNNYYESDFLQLIDDIYNESISTD